MRRFVPLVLAVMILAWAVPSVSVTAGTTEDEADLEELYQSLATMNLSLRSLHDAYSMYAFDSDVDPFDAEYQAFADALPDIHGVPFTMWASVLCQLGEVLDMMSGVTEETSTEDLEAIALAIGDAIVMKELLESLLHVANAPCQNGRALVVVYPGFDPHELRTTISDLLQDGKCVTVTWRVPEAYSLGLGLDANFAMEQLVFTALGTAFTGNSEFTIDPNAEDTDTTFDEVARLGDATLEPHLRQQASSSHANFGDAAIASGIVGGEPVRLGQNPVLVYDQPAGPWIQLQDVCGPTTVTMPVYSPLGTIVETFDFQTDPADAGVDCYSSSSSMDHFSLHDPAYWLPGTYWVEVWVNPQLEGGFSGSLAFTVQPPQLSPYVYGESYMLPADGSAVTGNVLANDYDLNGDPLTVSLATPPNHGALTLNPDGTFEYAPDEAWTGQDSFLYDVSDGVNPPVTSPPVVFLPVVRTGSDE